MAVNVGTTGVGSDLWVYDLQRDALARLTFEGAHTHAWSPDSQWLAYSSVRSREQTIFRKAADGSGAEVKLVTGEHMRSVTSWSGDGRFLAFHENHPTSRNDIWVVRLEGEPKAEPFLKTQFSEGGAVFSPGPAGASRWMAYVSDETSRYEVYVVPYPGPGSKWQISTGGGTEPLWSSDGRELFYRNGDKVMAVEVQTRPSFHASKPKVLFEGRYLAARGLLPYWGVSPDGKRFLVIKPEEEAGPPQLRVVVDWFEELKRRLPAGKK